MEMPRPRAVRPAERTVAAGPVTAGMVREVAFAGDDRWVGFVRSEAGVRSGWHHHGETDTYFFVPRGTIRNWSSDRVAASDCGSRPATSRTCPAVSSIGRGRRPKSLASWPSCGSDRARPSSTSRARNPSRHRSAITHHPQARWGAEVGVDVGQLGARA